MPIAAKIASSSVGGSRRTRRDPYFVFQSSLIGASQLIGRCLRALMLHCNMKMAWQYSHALQLHNFSNLIAPSISTVASEVYGPDKTALNRRDEIGQSWRAIDDRHPGIDSPAFAKSIGCCGQR